MPPAPQGDTTNAKQLIVDRIRQATNILVAVNANPSIDSLAAALALTLTLNKLDKHATAVFSGQVPPVMQFLNPEKTFENNVDSLRDFIISLDKEKADRLRYKLEKDVVRIFITPYRTTISEKDLQFSQGDFNVDLIIGLGVEKREDLDQTIVAHGRILHDAAVVTINANSQQSTLGAVDWHDPNSSSLCEMLVALTEALQKPGLLDAQIANALLTGIVAATDRFSNQHTTPKVMTMSAQLMAAGANQQLVVINMQKGEQPLPLDKLPPAEEDDLVSADGQLNIKHKEEPGDKAEAPDKKEGEKPVELDTQKAEDELAAVLPGAPKAEGDVSLDDLKSELANAAKEAAPEPAPEAAEISHKFIAEPPSGDAGTEVVLPVEAPKNNSEPDINTNSWQGRRLEPPARTGDASGAAADLAEKTRVEEEERNQTLLSHHVVEPPAPDTAAPSDIALRGVPSAPTDVAPTLTPAVEPPAEPAEPAPDLPGVPNLDSARQAVDSVYAAQPFDPAHQPDQDMGAKNMTELGDAQPYIPLPPNVPAPHTQGVTIQPPSQAPAPTEVGGLPVIPPMPSLPVQEPGMTGPPMPPPMPPLVGDQPQQSPTDQNQPTADPGQFKIPN